jgi:hypothetical protein
MAAASSSKMKKAAKTEGELGHLSEVGETTKTAAKIVKIWEPLLKNVEMLVAVGDKIAEVSLGIVTLLLSSH